MVRLWLSNAAMVLAMAAPAWALEPLNCPGDPDGAESWLQGHHYRAVTDDFVIYETAAMANGRPVVVLEHCPSRQQLVLTLAPEGLSPAAQARLDDMVWGPGSYALGDMATVMREFSELHAAVVQADYQSCACRRQADPATTLAPRGN